MAQPYSLLTRFRQWLDVYIDPSPDPGEGWCINCGLNDGRTIVLSADGVNDHINVHKEADAKHLVQIKLARPVPSTELASSAL
jgi:hypothetical protein